MIGLALYSDQIVKHEQYQDLLREVEHYRLIKAVAQTGAKPSRKAAERLRKPLVGLSRRLPGLRSISRARA
ncbi:MAG: hypothetical protein P8186_04920 [Anaerolineae bacterium]|jgi:hypothetical protein